MGRVSRVVPAGGSLLAALPARVREELLGIAETVRLPAQEWLFHTGDEADRLYLVASGRLRVVVEREGETRVARLLGPGGGDRRARAPHRHAPVRVRAGGARQ